MMIMKKRFTILMVSSIIVAGCAKSDTKCSYNDSNVIAPATEIDSLTHLITDTLGVTASQAPSGFFYNVSATGSGTGIANLCTNVTVTYKGTFFNGQVFDSTDAGGAATFQLGQVIPGWQKGVPLISKGGDITLYVPPTLGYGSNPLRDNQNNIIIPGGSYLIFQIHIVDIFQ